MPLSDEHLPRAARRSPRTPVNQVPCSVTASGPDDTISSCRLGTISATPSRSTAPRVRSGTTLRFSSLVSGRDSWSREACCGFVAATDSSATTRSPVSSTENSAGPMWMRSTEGRDPPSCSYKARVVVAIGHCPRSLIPTAHPHSEDRRGVRRLPHDTAGSRSTATIGRVTCRAAPNGGSRPL